VAVIRREIDFAVARLPSRWTERSWRTRKSLLCKLGLRVGDFVEE